MNKDSRDLMSKTDFTGKPPVPFPGTTPNAVVIGTAGHIDHGKTSLVRRLTGINTDRLPEEIKRGISIDLGFAHWKTPEFHFGVIDVPGHERFIKNMVAGSTGIDLALLVVAADDGVMPQTREHLEILDLLGVKTGLIAVTKVDLVEADFVDLVEAEIRETVTGSFLENCRLVRISSTSGFGFEELRLALSETARMCVWPTSRSVFRMPIDQVFSKSGQGTVVTGTVLSGLVKRDDIVELLPAGQPVRVRSVQQHREGADLSGARRRTGINLANVKCEDIHRGLELASPGYLKPTQRLLVSVRTLKSSPVELKDRTTFALYLGTTEVNARLVLKGRRLEPGALGFAELRVATPIVAEFGQHFILRLRSPANTVGGGQILDPNLPPRTRIKDLAEFAAPRLHSTAIVRLSALLSQQRQTSLPALEMACRTGAAPEEIPELLATLERQSLIRNVGTHQSPHWVHQDCWDKIIETARKQIRKLMAEYHPRRNIPLTLISNALRIVLGEVFSNPIQTALIDTKWLVGSGGNYGPAELQVQLSKRQQELRASLISQLMGAGLTPPGLKELSLQFQQPLEKLEPLLQLDVEEGRLIEIAGGLYYTIDAVEQIRRLCETFFEQAVTATVAQLRDTWGVTRKYSIPLCEWLDTHAITQRQGDLRTAGTRLHDPLTGSFVKSLIIK
ncbi:MAG: selenocysteine-specific translation elongation factor [Planctomycetaceae bacterium]|nr:selenocysteine-specific translation elongation factor [Planctomycetaceae bacterium]